jgi:hypothetical protein
MPRKVFVAGDPLTAAQVNTNLMDQSVMRFASAAARDAAIPSPSEGMMAYLDDQNWLMLYTGSAWTITGGDKPYFVASFSGTLASGTELTVSGTTNVNRGGFTNASGVITVPVAGIYSVSVWQTFSVNATGSRGAWIKSGSGIVSNVMLPSAGALLSTSLSVSTSALNIAAGATIYSTHYQNSGASSTVFNQLVIQYLGA